MLIKNYTKTKKKCRVTFKYPNQEHAGSARLAGEFNHWSTTDTPMKRLKDGSFSVTISLIAGCSYTFRYVLDESIWVNDPEADEYVANEHGETNSVVIL
ncbi:MAG: isoamylase early set domain-containing protein [Candidatus Electrothrix sp. GW3-4]|uniref:isoamylase early set domain-containing protein n=1 Tax=Candidatus Electrothrix sp. GW3-4 TaxID=3126740 RepID=UPI0030CE52BF